MKPWVARGGMLMPSAVLCWHICCKECLAIVRTCSYYVGSHMLERTGGCTSQKCNEGVLLCCMWEIGHSAAIYTNTFPDGLQSWLHIVRSHALQTTALWVCLGKVLGSKVCQTPVTGQKSKWCMGCNAQLTDLDFWLHTCEHQLVYGDCHAVLSSLCFLFYSSSILVTLLCRNKQALCFSIVMVCAL